MHAQLCLTLCNPWTVALQAPLSWGVSRQECCGELPHPPPVDLPDPGVEPLALILLALHPQRWQVGSSPPAPPGEARVTLVPFSCMLDHVLARTSLFLPVMTLHEEAFLMRSYVLRQLEAKCQDVCNPPSDGSAKTGKGRKTELWGQQQLANGGEDTCSFDCFFNFPGVLRN